MAPIVLAREGTGGAGWPLLLRELENEEIPLDYALSLIRKDCEAYLERFLAFCFSDGRITQEEVNVFNHLANSLQVDGQIRETMQSHINRGLLMTNIAAGQLPPTITPNGVQPQFDERFYLEIPGQYKLIRKSGNQLVYGRVLVSNTKFRFIGERSHEERHQPTRGSAWGPIDGWELGWSKILKVDTYDNGFDLCVTQRKGSGFYYVDDGVLAAEIIQLVLRIANRQSVSAVSHRERIPQAVKTAVWERDGGRCQECGATGLGANLEYDHLIPLSKGGATSVNNMQLLCRRCNGKKGGRI